MQTDQLELRTRVFQYLDDLRESGATNMFGAGAWVEGEFGLDRAEARKHLLAWMDTFDRDKTPAERAALVSAS